MKNTLTDTAMIVDQKDVLSMRVTHPMRLSCVDGRVWLTHSAVAGDTFLHSGEQIHLQAGGVVVIESLGGMPAQVELEAEPGLSARLCTGLAGVLRSAARYVEQVGGTPVVGHH